MDAAKGDTVNVDVISELEAVDIDEVHLVGKGANGFPALLAKGLDTSDTVTEIDRLLAQGRRHHRHLPAAPATARWQRHCGVRHERDPCT